MDKKLIFFDIDGTLISYKDKTYIPDSTIKAIKRLKQNGHIVAIATGRSYAVTKYILEKLDINYAVLHNGAQIIFENVSIYQKKIGKIISRKIINELIKTKHVVFAFDGENIYTNNATEESISYLENESRRKKIVKPLCDNKNSLFSIYIYGKTDGLDDLLCLSKAIEYKKDQSEITSIGVMKSNGIKRLAKLLNITKKDIIAVGDGINDIDMIKMAGIGIAVGNACKELKNASDIVTDNIEDDGILKVFESLNLI